MIRGTERKASRIGARNNVAQIRPSYSIQPKSVPKRVPREIEINEMSRVRQAASAMKSTSCSPKPLKKLMGVSMIRPSVSKKTHGKQPRRQEDQLHQHIIDHGGHCEIFKYPVSPTGEELRFSRQLTE